MVPYVLVLWRGITENVGKRVPSLAILTYNALPLFLCMAVYVSMDIWVYPVAPIDFLILGSMFFALQFMHMLAYKPDSLS